MGFAKILVLTLALTASQLHAQRITRFCADVELRKDGSAAVTEKVTVQGSPFLQRSLRLLVEDGSNSWDLDIKLLSVRDGNGNSLRHEAVVRGHHLDIRVPLSPPFDEPKTVLLNYEVQHGIVLYWEANSASFTLTFTDDQGWLVPTDKVLITATVPDDPKGGLTAGLNGPERKPQVTITGRTARLSGDNVPAAYWVTLGLSFPSSMVRLPVRDWLHQESARTGFGCLLALVLIGVMLWYRRSIVVNGDVRSAGIPMTMPPPTPAEPQPAEPTIVRRCRICGARELADSEELCATCIADRELLSRDVQPK